MTWTNRGILGNHLVSESFSITNRYDFQENTKDVIRMELLSSTFDEMGIGNKIRVRIDNDSITISGDNSYGIFDNAYFKYQDCELEKIFTCYSERDIPLKGGIELIEYRAPNPPYKIATITCRITYIERIPLPTTSSSSDSESSSEPQYEEVTKQLKDSFQIRVNYDNSISKKVIDNIINERRELNKQFWNNK